MVDVGHEENNENELWILDEEGNQLSVIYGMISTHNLIDWYGNDIESIIISEPPALYDGFGEKLAILETPVPKNAVTHEENIGKMAFAGDMSGDGIADIVLYTNPGSLIYIYKNESGIIPRDSVQQGTGVNYTLY